MNKKTWTLSALTLSFGMLVIVTLLTKQGFPVPPSSQVAAVSGLGSIILAVEPNGGDVNAPSNMSAASSENQSASTNSITQYGITWTFDKPYLYGQFANGDYWVVGPVTITSVSPNWDGTKNGSMIDPVPISSQGYDTRVGDYSSLKSVTFPVTISGISSLVSTIGLTECVTGGGAQCLNTAAVLTVVISPPDSSSFRPSYVAGDKKIWNASQVNYDLLPKLAVPPGVKLPNINNAMTRVWLDHGPKVTGAKIHPQSNMPPYPRDSSLQVSTLALMALLDVPQNKDYANRLIQLGIDLYNISLTNEDAFRAYGGFGSGRKWPILFAGIMLNDSNMQSPPKFISSGSTVNKFGEDGHTYYGEPTAEYPNGKPLWGQDCNARGLKEPFHSNHDCRDFNKILEAEKMQNGGAYRICCTSHTWIGAGLAAHIMKATSIWNHPAFFDYIDRWVVEPSSWANSKTNYYKDIYGYGGDGNGFIMAMWSNYRGTNITAPVHSTPTPTPTPTPSFALTPTPTPIPTPTPTPTPNSTPTPTPLPLTPTPIPTPNLSPVYGSCGINNNTCNSGIPNNLADSSTQYLWQCLGERGGTSAQCSSSINQIPIVDPKINPTVPIPGQINGYCGPSVNRCISGTFRDSPDSGVYSYWSCMGQNGGSNMSCNISKQMGFTDPNNKGSPLTIPTTSSQNRLPQSFSSPKVSNTSISLIPAILPTRVSFIRSDTTNANIETLQKFLETKDLPVRVSSFIEKIIFYLNVLLSS